MQMFRAGGKIAIKSQEPSTQFTTIKDAILFMQSHYRGFPPYVDFGAWEKNPRYAKFRLVGL